MIQVSDVVKRFLVDTVQTTALDHVNISIKAGEFAAVTGASGCGKSTLMSIAGGLSTPDSGRVAIEGDVLSDMSEKQMRLFRANSLGFVFQNFNLIESISAIDNVALPLRYAGLRNKDEIRSRAMQAMKRMEIHSRADHFPPQLSGGQQQRVAIARAVVNKPKVLLADEPTGNLDEASSDAVMDLFQDLNSAGTTILLVTHSPKVVTRAKRVILMENGTVTSAI